MKKKCKCDVCKFSVRFHKWRSKLPKSALKFADELYERMTNFEDDADYYNAIIDGSWHDADGIIKRTRKLRKAKIEKKVDGPAPYIPSGLKVDGFDYYLTPDQRSLALDKAAKQAFYDGLKKIK